MTDFLTKAQREQMRYAEQFSRMDVVSLINQIDALEKQIEQLAKTALAYDAAINNCANDPSKMASFCTATGETLDKLYFDWVEKAKAAHLSIEALK